MLIKPTVMHKLLMLAHRRPCALLLSAIASLTLPLAARSQPIQPAAGTGTQVTVNGQTFIIHGGTRSQDGANLFHSFQQFGLEAGQIADFLAQPGVQTILSRVTGGDPSVINGLLQGSGHAAHLYLMNPAGIVFGPDARLNVPGDFFATTATGIGFGNGHWFEAQGPNDYATLVGPPHQFAFDLVQPGSLINAGALAVNPGRSITLLAGSVANTGSLQAPGGSILVSAVPGTSRIRLSRPEGLLSLEIEPPRDASGQVQAFSPLDLPALLTGSGAAPGLQVNPDHTLTVLGAGATMPMTTGTVLQTGQLDVSSGATGGTIDLLGDRLALVGADLNASGSYGGGQIRIGGEYRGEGAIPTAARVWVHGDSRLQADATERGDGGRVILWADETMAFAGQIRARGGPQGGDGGFVEVSGRQDLLFRGTVDAGADQGAPGQVLLDPENILIVSGGPAADDGQLADGQILAGDSPGATFTISAAVFAGLTGNIILEATNNITIADFPGPVGLGSPGTVSLTFRAGNQFTMQNLSNTIETDGASLTIQAANGITIGSIDTTPGTVQPSGSVRLETSALGANISFGSIQTSNPSGAPNGDVDIVANGLVFGRNSGVTIFTDSGSGTGGAVRIQHDGGPNNVPFVIGGATVNGTVGSILTPQNPTGLSGLSLPVTPTTATVTFGDVAITSVNSLPAAVPLGDPFATIPGDVPYSFTYNQLLALFSDPNLDNLRLSISNIIATGKLTLNGQDITGAAGTLSLNPGDTLSYFALQALGSLKLFDLTASDGVALTTTGITLEAAAPLNLCLLACGVPQLNGEDTLGDLDLAVAPMLNPAAIAEAQFSQEFADYLGLATPETLTLDEMQEILRDIERATGIKPALLYVQFFPADPTASQSREPAESAAQKSLPAPPLPGQTLWQFGNGLAGVELGAGPRPFPSRPDDYLELVLVTARDTPVRYPLRAVTRAQVAAVASQLRRAVTSPARGSAYLEPAQALYRWLLAPLEPVLQEREIGNIAFILEAGLRSLPLAVLHDGDRFALERYSMGLMPSLSLTDNRYTDPRTLNVLAMGASTFADQAPLPAVPAEIQLIGEQLWSGRTHLDQEFTPQRLRRARSAAPYGIVHLATHGEFRPGNPSNSYISFWNQQLTLAELRTLNLTQPAANLLVLSACRTALGDREAELGFAGLAVQAGIPTALGSLWYVSDQGTLAFMASFYHALRQAPIKAEALRQAQLAMARGEVRLTDREIQLGDQVFPLRGLELTGPPLSFEHPYYWSAFTAIGSPW